jgi:hypothetical protein
MLVWELCIEEIEVLRIAGAFVLGTMAPALSTLLAFLPGQQTLFDRAKAGVTPNELAFVLVLSLPISYYLILRDKSPTSALFRLHLGLAVCAILMSGSAATLIAMAVALTLFCWTFHLVPARTRLNMFAMAMLLAGAAIVFLPSSIWKTLAYESRAGSVTLAVVADTGTAAVRSTPFGGYGAAAALHVPAAKYFTLFTETGIIGVFCFGIMLAILFSAAERMGGAARSFWFTELAVWAIGAWAFNLESSPAVWLLFALLAAHSASLHQSALTATERSRKQTYYIEQAEVWS